MVSLKDIHASNALINDTTAPLVSVFVGGTSGIGKATIKALVSTGTSIRIYIVGRKSSEPSIHTFIQDLSTINPNAEIIWTEAEISLLAETKRVCEVIKTRESRVDLLFLTAGYAPFGPRQETAEGVEIAQSLEYYSRILFVQHLLPLLTKSKSPRVISVLGGGLERAIIDLDDLDLKTPGNFSGIKAQTQYMAMNTMGLETLADQNPDVTFIHSWPGWVSTGNVRRGHAPDSIMAWVIWLVLEPLINVFSYSEEESAQRYLFQSTSAAFGGRGVSWTGKPGVNSLGQREEETAGGSSDGGGGGLFLVNYKCECTQNAKALTALREKAKEKVWDHTQEVLRPYL